MAPISLPHTFTRRQAIDLGVSDFRLRGMVLRGEVARLRTGVYTRREEATHEAKAGHHLDRARAALDHYTTGFVASHLTAAAAYGLPLPLGATGDVHLTAVAAVQQSRRAPGVVVHHGDSAPVPLDTADGLAVTSVARTLADCLRCFDARVAIPLADHALREGMTVWEDIRAELGRQRRWRGRPRALQALRLVDGRRETWLESYAFTCLGQWGVALPVPQVTVLDEDGALVARVDGAWTDDLTVLEVDGRQKYGLGEGEGEGEGPDAAFFREKSRHNDLCNLGLAVVRCELTDLVRRSSMLVQQVGRQRAAGRRGRFGGRFVVPDPTGLTAPPSPD